MAETIEIRHNPSETLPATSALTKPLRASKVKLFSVAKGSAESPRGAVYAYNVSPINQNDWPGIVQRHSKALETSKPGFFENPGSRAAESVSVVLDCSYEGPAIVPAAMKRLDDAVAELGNVRQAVVLTQNEAFSEDLRKLELTHVKAVVVHSFSHMVANGFVRLRESPYRFASYLKGIHPSSRAVPAERRYTCLINRTRMHRIVLFGWLKERGILGDGFVSCHGGEFVTDPDRLEATLREARNQFPSFENEIATFAAAVPELPFKNFHERGDLNFITSFNFDAYRSGIALVPETEMTLGPIRRYTEKSLKPLLSGQVVVILGNPGTLALLRDMGFSAPWLDQDYDLIVDREKRFLAAMDVFQNFLAMTPAAIEDMRLAAWPHIEGNIEAFVDRIATRIERSTSELYDVLAS